MNIGWPQAILLAFAGLGLAISIARDGQPRGNYSASGFLASALIELILLYWGGFFS